MVADNLRHDYMENKHRYDTDQEEWPPNQPKTVVNVALIHYKGSRTEQELIEISKRHKDGTSAVDELAHHSRVTKDIAKIFSTDFISSTETGATDKPPKFILIEGAPGIGKTVLAKKIAYLWAKKEILIDTNILFLLFLRDPDLQKVETPEQLIQYFSNNRLNEEKAANCVKQIMEVKVGVIMDGYDEFPSKLRKKSFIANLIKSKVFHDSVVVLTSRPTATISLHDKVDRRVEILGFAQEERDKYISKSLDSPKQRKELQDYLKCQPIINGLIYVPLHLAILLYLFKNQSKLPETLTEMNESFIIHTIFRSLTKNELTSDAADTVVANVKDLPKNVLDIVKALSKLAFIGLQNKQLVFSYFEVKAVCPQVENDMPGAFYGFGLLQVVQHLPKRGAGTTVSFNFLHFTMQEFLAALHVSDAILPKEQLQLMKKTFWSNTYNFMWMMYIGINGVNSEVFLQFLYKAQTGSDIMKLTLSDSIMMNKLKCLHLFQCFMEAKNSKVPKEISSIFYNDEINFLGVQLLPYHVSSITLYISKYSTQLQFLNLRDCHIGDVGMSILEHFFIANPGKVSRIKYIDLFGNNSVLLWNVYCSIFGQQNLTKLNWSSCLRGVNIEEIITVIDNNMIVQSLNISKNYFKDDDAEKIAKVLSGNGILKELDLSYNSVSIKGAITISKSLKYNTTLQHLKLSWNNQFIDTSCSTLDLSNQGITTGDLEILTNILFNNRTITELSISQNKIADDGALCVSECIKNNKSLRNIDLSGNRISNHGFRGIISALCINQTLRKLDVSENLISDDGAVAISEYLKNTDTLQEINMSHNRVTNTGIICIGRVLPSNETLKVLDISHNKVSDVGILTFSNYLKFKNTLQELRISWSDGCSLVLSSVDLSCSKCGINFGDNGATFISAFLYSNGVVQKLDLSYNNIANIGTVSISECLKNNNTLRELNISHNTISNNGITYIVKGLQTNTTLQKLDVSNNNLSDYAALVFSDYLKDKNTIQELNISHNKISNNGIISIAKGMQANFTLKLLDISHNKVTNDGVRAISECLKSNNTLQELNMSHNEVSDDGIIKIGKALQINMALLVFDISNNNITDYGALTISECLKSNSILQELNMSHSNTSDDVISMISEDLEANTTLVVTCNHLSDDEVVTIGKYLSNNSTLQKLNMANNNISDERIIKISRALETNTTLHILDISYNNISDDGAIAISEYLKYNDTLEELNLSHNKVSDDGTIEIGKAMETNTALCRMNISYNKISDVGAVAISECLKNNNTLQELNMSHNSKVSHDLIIKINKTLQRNLACNTCIPAIVPIATIYNEVLEETCL